GWNVLNQAGTGYATMQLQEEYLIPPDEVRRLETGEVFLIANGQGQKARIAPLAISPEQQAEAFAFLASEEAAEQPETTSPSMSEPPGEADSL
ncbi:MAG TPA: hypothetical protein VFV38_15805, partial [Ktedonobacteraceae bacterium]|nr:hypothetical protein [Ktedonobacteraceae bacterium]